MHDSVYDFVNTQAILLRLRDEDKTILEIGSRDVNGTLRPIFKGKYTGFDMLDGACVDFVMNANNAEDWHTNIGDNKYDVILYCEVMEHDLAFWKTWENLTKYLKKDGYFIASTRGIGFKYHEWPHDHYRFTMDSFKQLPNLFGLEVVYLQEDPQELHSGVFGVFKLKK